MKPAERRSEQAERGGRRKPAYQLEVGTKSLLAGLLALAVVCGMFFAFGYTIGKHAIPATFTLGSAPPVSASSPAAPSGVQAPNPAQLGAAESNQTPNTLSPPVTTVAGQPGAAGTPPATAPATAGGTTSTNAAGAAPPPAPTAAAPSALTPPAAPAPHAPSAVSGVYQVQVFAGMLDDAQSLATALQNRGYPANVVAPAANQANQLYRVEVGPYLTRAEADAMRSRLTADGYQAVIKGKGNQQ